MIYVIIILLAALAASVMANIYLHNELLDERNRSYESAMWIDPISWETTKGEE